MSISQALEYLELCYSKLKKERDKIQKEMNEINRDIATLREHEAKQRLLEKGEYSFIIKSSTAKAWLILPNGKKVYRIRKEEY